MTEHIGAEPYERTDQRRAYRNGYRPRQLTTRVGTLTLRVPQTRGGSFSTELFRRYQRPPRLDGRGAGPRTGLMEMVVQGVSTRKVTRITDRLCGTSFSKSTVSSLCYRKQPLCGSRDPRRGLEESPARRALPLRHRRCDRREGATRWRRAVHECAPGHRNQRGGPPGGPRPRHGRQ